MTDEGAEIELTATSPDLLCIQLKAAVKRSLEREVGRSWAKRDAAFEGRRVCADLAVAALNSKGAGGKLERGAYRSALCGAVMTMSRAVRLGYDVEDRCPLCGEPGDTVRHRTFLCRCTEKAVREVVPEWFIKEAIRAKPSDLFWTTGVIPHPGDTAPQAAEELVVVVENGDGNRADSDEAITAIGGRVYVGGSCQPSKIDGLARAGACVTEVDMEGRMVRKLTCAVPKHLPQTAQAAEHLAPVVAIRCTTRQADMFGDCLGVVKALSAPGGTANFARKRYGGLLLDTASNPERRGLCSSFTWVKAHKAEDSARDDEERLHIRGNALADKGAAEAVGQHPQFGNETKALVEFYEKRAGLVIEAVGTAMSLFPPAPGDMKKACHGDQGTAGPGGSKDGGGGHRWTFSGGAWRCETCWTWLTGDRHPRSRAKEKCEGGARCSELARFTDKGHRMAWADGSLPFAFCTRCGSWASRRPRGLLLACGQAIANGRLALQRIARGLHPWQKREKKGGLQPRTRIRVDTKGAVEGGQPPAKRVKKQGVRRMMLYAGMRMHVGDRTKLTRLRTTQVAMPLISRDLAPRRYRVRALPGARRQPRHLNWRAPRTRRSQRPSVTPWPADGQVARTLMARGDGWYSTRPREGSWWLPLMTWKLSASALPVPSGQGRCSSGMGSSGSSSAGTRLCPQALKGLRSAAAARRGATMSRAARPASRLWKGTGTPARETMGEAPLHRAASWLRTWAVVR